jgi:hypothetical protein
MIAVALCTFPPAALAQQPSASADDPRTPPECFRFAFGAWSPTLDWQGAGHRNPPGAGEQGAHGRANAVRTEREGEGPLLLFPAFWPAGVLIRFDRTAPGDTLRGTATALVADASRTASVAPVTIRRVPCGAPR